MTGTRPVLIIGNAPSSGSSLLGVLLDSTPVSACGPELNLFTSYTLFVDYPTYQKNPFCREYCPSIYIKSNALNVKRLEHYAMSQSSFTAMANDAQDANEFIAQIAERFCCFRGKNEAMWVEKTPQNISNLSAILSSGDKQFLHIVRNPLHVMSSLIRRGMRIEIAALTWLFDVAHYMTYADRNCSCIRYEDLVTSPWETVSSIIGKITGHKVSPEEVEYGYGRNCYRKQVSRKLGSWQYSQHGIIGNANREDLDYNLLRIAKELTYYRLSRKFALKEKVKAISFKEALEYFGYRDTVVGRLKHVNPSNVLSRFSLRTRLFMAEKNISKHGVWAFGKRQSFNWLHRPIEKVR